MTLTKAALTAELSGKLGLSKPETHNVIMKIRLLITFASTRVLLSSGIIAAPCHGGHGCLTALINRHISNIPTGE